MNKDKSFNSLNIPPSKYELISNNLTSPFSKKISAVIFKEINFSLRITTPNNTAYEWIDIKTHADLKVHVQS
ncbi:hypothetical protein [Clostridium diolis]|uniref:hypothetical protein n=1 Tax=Clostridium diolis TaxID=223919 RepID=UPI003119B173